MKNINFVAAPGKQEIELTYLFDAPVELVFQTYIDPERIPQWWGPKYLTTSVEKMEVRPGGQWRFIQCDAGFTEYAFHGVYHLVAPPRLLVLTFEYGGMPEHVLLESIHFEAQDGNTLVTDRTIFQSVEDRDGMLQSGMEEGSSESMERFAALLETQNKKH